MQINNIALTADKCIKPHRLTGFEGNNNSTNKRKVRYKHYEELSDDVLKARSIIKAHQDVQNGGKMRLYKALPAIATGIVTTSLAITRPGKLSDKLVTGLGFLATLAGFRAINDIAFSDKDTERKKGFATLGALTAIGIGISAVGKNAGNTKSVSKFLTKEAKQLAKEINKTKLAKYSNDFIEPLIEKRPKLAAVTPLITVAAASVGNAFASVGLLKGISKDISTKACQNYEKGKLIQQIARNHFDSVDAIEV